MLQIGQIPPHVSRGFTFGLCQHPGRHRGRLTILTSHNGFALQVTFGGEFELEGHEGAAGSRSVLPGEGLSTHGTGAPGFAVAGVVAALLFAEAEGVDDAFVAEEVACRSRF